MNSVSVENFVKNVFTLKRDEGAKVSATLLAERLGVSGPAITDMAKKLASRGLIVYKPYKELELTNTGLELALKVLRRHRIWELFLYKVLKMDLGEVHTEAEVLEHQTSDKLLAKMDAFLNYPTFDPHGDPIPAKDGSLGDEDSVQLDALERGDEGIIVRLIYSGDEVKSFYDHYQIETQQRFKITNVFTFDHTIEIEINGRRISLSLSVQKLIYCIKKKK